MSNYNKSTNFAVKDTLQTGDPEKLVSGAEIDNEFNAISSAITTKTDKKNGAATDNLAAFDANGNLKDSGESISSVETKIANAIPTGTVSIFASVIEPDGWVICDGRELDRSEFSDLFDAIGTQFGTTSSTNFKVPDLRGEFVRGWDNNRGVDNNRSFGSSQLDQMQRITGKFNGGRELNSTREGAFTKAGAIVNNAGSDRDAQVFQFDSADSPNARTSSTTDGETRPRNIALNYIIKT